MKPFIKVRSGFLHPFLALAFSNHSTASLSKRWRSLFEYR